GFGITYLAHDFNLNHEVAIKEYLPLELAVREQDFSVQPAADTHGDRFKWGLDRFMTEAQTLACFKHPNIVRVLAVFEANGTGYMVMEYEEGDSLKDILARRQTLEEDELLNIVLPILGGLEKVHERGFIHRDIKPANLFIRDDGSPVLIDFGSARQALGAETRALTTLVSPGYAPFEQYYSKGEQQGPWTDIYGLGATLYRAVTGQPPQDAVDRSRAILEAARDTLADVAEIGQGRYSARFLKAIDHALQFRQRDRPQSVAEWRREFGVAPDSPPSVAFLEDAMATFVPADEPRGEPIPPAGPPVARCARPDVKAVDRGPHQKPAAEQPRKEPITPAEPSLVWRTRTDVQSSDSGQAAKPVMNEPRHEPTPPAAPSTARRTGIALALLAAVAAASYWAYLRYSPAPPQEVVASDPSGQGQKADIPALLAQAQVDVAALRLTAPAGGNALEKYRKIIELAPDNAAAKQGLQGIADRFVALAQQATAAGGFDQAAEYLQQAAAIVPDASNIALVKNELALEQAARERETAEAKRKQDQAQAALRAADEALARDDASSVLARLDEARQLGVDAAVLDDRRRGLRDRVETLATAAGLEAKQALQKNDAAAARAAIKRARDLKAQADALDPAQP
ncbi:MAG: protein kinase domain-containing protein, partial [Gammaproteobacteria bacterium]